MSGPSKRWNLFARVLEDILGDHNLRLTQLDDRAGVHREKVRRLSKSLLYPKSFPVLNPHEMKQVISSCGLDSGEVLLLRAAVMATAVEETLMNRIDRDNALLAAEQIFAIILKALQEFGDGPDGLSQIKGVVSTMYDEDIDVVLDDALELVDRANIALHLSQYTMSNLSERLLNAQKALEWFGLAIEKLNQIDPNLNVKINQAWRIWLDEANNGIKTAQDYVEQLAAKLCDS